MTVLDFSFARRTPLLLQTEAAECGLACLAMVAGFHGHRIDMATLRARHSISLKGSSLTDLMRLAGLGSAGLLCEILSEDGSMARLPELREIAAKWDMKIVTIADTTSSTP